MKENRSVKELAKLFQVAPSALRYWDRLGLIRFTRGENNYRLPNFDTMLDLCDVVYYRSISLPLEEVAQVPRRSVEELEEMLTRNRQSISEKIKALQEVEEKTKERQAMLARLQNLRKSGFQVVQVALPAIRPFSFEDPALVNTFIHDGYQAAILLQTSGALPQYGIFSPGYQGGLREQDDTEQPYLTGLLQLESYAPERGNQPAFYSEAKALGYTPGPLWGRYLITACEGSIRYDYYEAWLELG